MSKLHPIFAEIVEAHGLVPAEPEDISSRVDAQTGDMIMRSRKPQEIADIRSQWENYALTHSLPMRCETNIVYHDGSCIVCSAVNGQNCQRAKPPCSSRPAATGDA